MAKRKAATSEIITFFFLCKMADCRNHEWWPRWYTIASPDYNEVIRCQPHWKPSLPARFTCTTFPSAILLSYDPILETEISTS
jgi:hypothetical protein